MARTGARTAIATMSALAANTTPETTARMTGIDRAISTATRGGETTARTRGAMMTITNAAMTIATNAAATTDQTRAVATGGTSAMATAIEERTMATTAMTIATVNAGPRTVNARQRGARAFYARSWPQPRAVEASSHSACWTPFFALPWAALLRWSCRAALQRAAHACFM